MSVIEDLKSLIPDIDTQVGGATTIRQFSDTLKGFIKTLQTRVTKIEKYISALTRLEKKISSDYNIGKGEKSQRQLHIEGLLNKLNSFKDHKDKSPNMFVHH